MFRPSPYDEPIPTLVSTFHSNWSVMRPVQVPSSAVQETTSTTRIIWGVIDVRRVIVAKGMWWANGVTAMDVPEVAGAIYRSSGGGYPGAKLAQTAATVHSGANRLQYAALSGGSVVLTPGPWWLGLAFDCRIEVADWFRSSGSSSIDAYYKMMQNSVTIGSLPATATPVEASNSSLWVFGLATTLWPGS